MANATQQIDAVARVYAGALLELANEAGVVDEVADEMRQLGELVDTHPDVRQLLGTRMLSAEQRGQAIDGIFKGRVSDLVLRFLHVVNDKARLDALAGIAAAFAVLLDEQRGIVDVHAHVAHPLDAGLSDHVTARISEAIGKQVRLHEEVDQALIGGLKIQFGDTLMDGSVAAQLKLLRRKMVESGRDRGN